MMCQNLMRFRHISQNDRSHEIVTDHLGTKFWRKFMGCVAFPCFFLVALCDQNLSLVADIVVECL